MERYAGRISGPLRDRIDLVVEVPAIGSTTRPSRNADPEELSAAIRRRVLEARDRQRTRFVDSSFKLNSRLEGGQLREQCALDSESTALLETAIQKFCLSARGCDRVLRVSRTIADLAGAPQLHVNHVAEALQYRFIFA
jgi:magnesium chelatase family protein